MDWIYVVGIILLVFSLGAFIAVKIDERRQKAR